MACRALLCALLLLPSHGPSALLALATIARLAPRAAISPPLEPSPREGEGSSGGPRNRRSIDGTWYLAVVGWLSWFAASANRTGALGVPWWNVRNSAETV